MNTRKPLAALLAVGALLVMTACSSPAEPGSDRSGSAGTGDTALDKLIADAKAEGTFTVYASSSPGLLDLVIPAFEKEYGIHPNVLRLNSGELSQRFLAEGDSSEADVLEIPIDFFDANQDLFLKLDESQIPGYDEYPEAARTVPAAVVSYVSPWVVVYNTDQVKEGQVPDTWADVAKDFKGKYLLTDPQSSSSYMAFVNELQKAEGDGVVEELGKNKGQLSDSAATAAQQVASGEFAMSVPNYPGQVPPLRDQGAPLAYKVIQSPAKVLPMALGIPASAPHSAAARLFLYWRMSRAGQQIVCDTEFSGSTLAGAGGLDDCKVALPDGWQPYETGYSDARRKELLTLMGL